MQKVIFSFSLCLLIVLTGCTQSNYSRYNGKTWEQLIGSGKLIDLPQTVTAFNSIEISNMNVKVILLTGASEYAVQVSVDDNLATFFRSKQEDGTLKLSMDLSGGKYNRWLSSNNTVITIKAPSVESFLNKGNTHIDVMLKDQSFFNFISEGNADVIMTGKVNTLNLQSAGNSDINAGNLFAKTVSISSTGNSDIVINSNEVIEKKIEGNNEIKNLYGKTELQIEKEKKTPATDDEFISIKLKNNSMFPFKATVITYRPDEEGNGTSGFMLMPMATKKFYIPVGTKFYIATEAQINTVMSGAKITNQQPFLTVKKEDDGKTFNLKN
jgi:Putative auto-transporter adhesin, head GIN domain